MFHLGKVVELFGNDDWDYKKLGSEIRLDKKYGSTVMCRSNAPIQATIEMWDDNVMTFVIDDDIVEGMEIGDIVLVDYTLTPSGKDGIPIPRNTIVKVMKGGVGERAWTKYREFHQKRMQVVTQAQSPMYR